MNKFVGQGYLIEASIYEKDGNENYKYVLLLGEEESKSGSGYLLNAHIETVISDKPLLKGGSFMEIVPVAVSLKRIPKKVNGQLTFELMASYAIDVED